MKLFTARQIVFVVAVVVIDLLILDGLQTNIRQTDQASSVETVSTAVAATESALATERARQSPTLLAPDANAVFDNAAAVKLSWNWYRPLADDEVFDLRVWRTGDPANGITWTKDQSFDLQDWLLYQQAGEFNWSVDVVQRQEDGSGEVISDAAPTQQFTMSVIDMKLMTVPPGFSVAYYGKLPFKQPTVVTFGPDGAMYALSVEGDVARLSDDNGDHFAENVKAIYTDSANQLDHAVGMAFHDNVLYISDGGRISTLTDSNGDGILDTLHPIVTGLPSQLWTFHSNNGIAFGPDNKLYVGVGSTTDHGPLRVKYEASILRMNPDGSDLETFATGFRNPYDLAFSPKGELFTADNSPDHLDSTLAYLPPEEVDYVQQGKDYGFPTQFGFPDSASTTMPPVVDLFTSSASAGITYQDSAAFPPEYHGLFLAQFGTGADAPVAAGLHTGRQVVFVALTPDGKGGYRGTWQPFATFNTDLGAYTPIDVTVGPDGALYIAEWQSATVYRVTYTGSAATPEPTLSPAAVGEQIFRNGVDGAPACISCHSLDPSQNTPAPSLVGLADRAGSRVPGLSAEDYVRQSIMTPNAYVVPSYGAGLMFQNYANVLTTDQINDLIAYVLTLKAS